MFLISVSYPFAESISIPNSVTCQKNRYFNNAVNTSTLANPTHTSRGTLRSSCQSRRTWFQSQENPCGIFDDLSKVKVVYLSIIKHVTLQKIVAHYFRYDPRIII